MQIGPRIRQLREEKGLSQTQVEEKSGILRTSLSRYENGHQMPTLETLERIAATLDVPLYRFFYTDKGTPKG
jgi:transcriptional regulator with XRE-family HTH domain